MDPQDATKKESKSTPGRWIQKWSKSKPGKCYYFNDMTRETTWTRPSGTVLETPRNSSTREAPVKRNADPDIVPNQKKSRTHDISGNNNGIESLKPATVLQTSSSSTTKLEKPVPRPRPIAPPPSTVNRICDGGHTSKHPYLGNADKSHEEQTSKNDQGGILTSAIVIPQPIHKRKRRKAKRKSSQNVPTTNPACIADIKGNNAVSNPSNIPGRVDIDYKSTAPSVVRHSVSLDDAIRASPALSSAIPLKKSEESLENLQKNALPTSTKCWRSADSRKTDHNAVKQNVLTMPSPCHKLDNKSQEPPQDASSKGTAQKRLKRLQESFQTKKLPIVVKTDLCHSKDSKKLAISEHFHKIAADNLGPAGKRLVDFQSNLKSEQKKKEKFLPSSVLFASQGNDVSVQLPINNNVGDCEAMEVEYMESEVLFDIGELRQKDVCLELNQQPMFMDIDMDCSINESDPNSILYIVLDTNILLSHLKFTAELQDSTLPGRGPVHLYLPWQVLHELDHLKDRGKLSIQPLARRAINYLHGNFSSKHPRVRGQKLSEATQNSSNCADDNILRSCLQLKEQGCDVILLSNDINLCNKALVCDVTAVSKDQFYEQFYSGMKVISTKNNNSEPQNGLWKHDSETPHSSHHDIILCDLKTIIRETLTEIVSRGMEDEYKHLWKKCTILPPPWETDNVLHCLSHHWLPICGDFTPPFVCDSIRKLRDLFKSMAKCYRSNASDIKESFELSKAVFGAISKKYNDAVGTAIRKIEELEIKLSNNDTANKDQNFSSTWTVDETDKRVLLVLACFEAAHNATQSICSVESLATPDLIQKATCMMEAVQTLMHLLKLLLNKPVHSLNEEDPVVNELVCLIKGTNSITASDFVCFFKKDGIRTLIENGIQQFASFEVQLSDMLQKNL